MQRSCARPGCTRPGCGEQVAVGRCDKGWVGCRAATFSPTPDQPTSKARGLRDLNNDAGTVGDTRSEVFFAAHLQSQLGTGAGYVALVLIAYQRLHHGWAIALVLLADVLPGIALAVPFGVLADRLRRTRLAVGAEVLRAGAFLGLAIVSSFTGTVLLALVAGVGTALFRPTIGAALPQLVSDDQRSPATALYGAITSLGITLGPAVTAPALLFFSPAMVLGVNGATFFISALLLSRVSLGVGGRQTTEERAGSLWRSASEAFRVTRVPKGVGTLLLISAVSVFAGAVMNVAEPLLATGPLHAGNAGYSILIAFYGTGLVTGSLLCAKAGSCLSRLRRLLDHRQCRLRRGDDRLRGCAQPGGCVMRVCSHRRRERHHRGHRTATAPRTCLPGPARARARSSRHTAERRGAGRVPQRRSPGLSRRVAHGVRRRRRDACAVGRDGCRSSRASGTLGTCLRRSAQLG